MRAILSYKLHPSHILLQATLLEATCRRVQWLREVARLDATGRQKSVEELGLTLLFVAIVPRWIDDGSEDFERTRVLMARRLERDDRLMTRWFD